VRGEGEPPVLATIPGAVAGALTAPFYLAADLTRGVLVAPATWYTMLFKRDKASAVAETEVPYAAPVPVSLGGDARTKSERFFAGLDNFNPVKLPASVLVEEGGSAE
jgi:hypothetical protein